MQQVKRWRPLPEEWTIETCSRCGHRAAENRLSQAAFRCAACGHAAHADVNAAVNMLRAGLALREAAEAA